MVTAVSTGTATITCTSIDGGFIDTNTVTVNGGTGTTYYSTRLAGTPTERYGLAKSISVMPGDIITAEVFVKYLDTNNANWTAALTNLITAIANGTAPTGTLVDGGAPGSLGGKPFPVPPIDHSNETGSDPKAYLNYIVFGKTSLTPLDFGFKRVSSDAQESGEDGAHQRLAFDGAEQIVIKEPGYVYIYLSNENGTPVEVYFDDFKVTHVKSPVVASNDYYPFGLTFNSYQRENSVANRYKFNGMEESQDLGINWLFPSKFRTYDPVIGRFNAIDPLADKSNNISPYAFAMNNPLLFTDLTGADTIRTTVLQEVVVTATRLAYNTYNWFTGADVGYSGSGWGHGPRRAVAGMMGLGGNANNLFQLGLHSQLQSGKVNLTGELLGKIKTDPALVNWQNQLIKILKSDPRFGKMRFVYKDGRMVGFGGSRTGGDNWNKLSLDNPVLQSSTWEVAGNALTWAVRNVNVNVEATVKGDGTIVLNYGFTDSFDLSSQSGRSGAYNFISDVTGFIYHDVAGGNSSLQVNANWETTIDE